jgi:tetratricopeptide (TPR) repeat protein
MSAAENASPSSPPAPAPPPSWRALFALRSVRLYFVVCGVVAALTALQPLFAVMGPELALVLGLVLPLFAAPMGARLVVEARMRGTDAPRALLRRALAISLVGPAIPVLAAIVSGLVRGFCDPWSGALFVALGPGVGVPLAALAGVVAASLTERPRLATFLAWLVPVGSIALGIERFVGTPAIFAYTHFVGYFPGTLYDPDIAVEGPYWALRLGSLALAVALAVTFEACFDGRRLALGRLRRAPFSAALVATLALGLALAEAYGPELGLRSTSASIARELGGRYEGERCVVLVPRELPRAQAERLRDDCDFRVARAEEVLGVTQPTRITAFFFRTTEEKRRLMGASNTYIAKPWRNEVYLQLGGWPHPVLFHEVVHVVAGNVGRGPFRVSGSIGGMLPSAGIIEGVAVAVAWDEREDLTPHQWARALVEVGHAPSIEETEGLGFLLQPASRAYTASGSFVRWILETRGSGAVRRLYASGSYEETLGMPLAEAEAEWRAFLETVPLPPYAVPMARLRFERPAIFGQICPHAIASLEEELGAALGSGDDARALARCEAILALDEGQAGVRAVRVGALARSGRIDEAEAELAVLVGPPAAATPIVVRAREQLGDAHWQRGELERARALYEANLAVPQPEDARRQIDVRLYGLEHGREVAGPLLELLAPDARVPHDAATQLAALAALDDADPGGLAPYLVARQLFARERFDMALPRLVTANERRFPTPLILREAERMWAISLYATGDLEGARQRFEAIAADARDASEGDVGRLVEAEDWLARIRWARARAASR